MSPVPLCRCPAGAEPFDEAGALRHPLHPALLGDFVDSPADIRVGLQELFEIAGAQFQQRAVGQRHHVGPPGTAIDQRHLAEEIAAPKRMRRSGSTTSTAPDEMKYIAVPLSPVRMKV